LPAECRELVARLRRELTARNYSSRTQRNYAAAVHLYLAHEGPPDNESCEEAFTAHLCRLIEIRRAAPSTINLHAAAIAFFLEHVAGIDTTNLPRKRMKTGRPLPKVYSREETARILEACTNEKHRLMLALAYGCGLRLAEIRMLRIGDIEPDRGILTVRKGKGCKDRIVMLPEEVRILVSRVAGQHPADAYLFQSPSSPTPLCARTFQKVYDAAVAKAQVPRKGGIHALRHTFATHLLEQGTDVRYIQALLGHSSSKTTEIYTHVATDRVANILSPISCMPANQRTDRGA